MEINKMNNGCNKRFSYFGLILLTTIFVSLVIISQLYFIRNDTQIFQDIVVEFTARDNSNKTAEVYIMFSSIFWGAGLLFIFLWRNKRYYKSQIINENYTTDEKTTLNVGTFILTAVLFYFNYKSIPMPLSCLLIVIAAATIKDHNLIWESILCYFICFYGFCGCYRFIVHLLPLQFSISLNLICFMSITLVIWGLFLTNRQQILRKIALIFQVFIPGVLLLIVLDKYRYNSNVMIIHNSKCIRLGVFSCILFAFYSQYRNLLLKWNKTLPFNDEITIITCIVVAIFNSLHGTGAVMSSDVHHPFENVIAFSQMFIKGQSAFQQFLPVSGLYSLVQGALFHYLGDGLFSNYHVTSNIFWALSLLLSVYLLDKHMRRDFEYILCIILPTVIYNRSTFLLSLFLLLSLPQLMNCRSWWLPAWYLSSLFMGLYYPIYGVALCLGFSPFVCKILWEFYNSKHKLKQIPRKEIFKFTAVWLLLFTLTLCASPWLWGTAKHILAMAGQSHLADGITRLGQLPPSNFLRFLSNEAERVLMYDLVTYLLPALPIWLSIILLFILKGRMRSDIASNSKTICAKNELCVNDLYTCVSLPIILLVCYSYSFVRIDVNSFLARSRTVLIPVLFVLVILSLKLLKLGYRQANIIYIISLGVLPVFTNWGVNSVTGVKLSPYFEVPAKYIHTTGNESILFGEGFIQEDVYNRVMDFSRKLRSSDIERPFYGLSGRFGMFYLNNLRGVGALECNTAKSYAAAQEIVSILKSEKPIVDKLPSLECYYLYKWLLVSGNYIFDKNRQMFVYNSNNANLSEVHKINCEADIVSDGRKMGNYLSSMGDSFKTLANIFTVSALSYNLKKKDSEALLQFHPPICGHDIDFIYIDFNIDLNDHDYVLLDWHRPVKKQVEFWNFLYIKRFTPDIEIRFTWEDNKGKKHHFSCLLNRGKILVPLGAGNKWLLNEHNYVQITASKKGKPVILPRINEIKFLKLRELL